MRGKKNRRLMKNYSYYTLTSLLFITFGCQPANQVSLEEQTTEATSTAPQEHPLRIALDEDLPSLDPHLQLTIVGQDVLFNVYEALTTTDPEGKLQPGLAERWERVDPKTWHFYLRQGVLFHNGNPLTAADVVASLDRAQNHPQSEVSTFLSGVVEISADANLQRVEIKTELDMPLLLHSLIGVSILPQDAPEEVTQPIGTGPYRCISCQPGEVLRLESFADYWRGPAPEAQAEFHTIPQATQALNSLASGEIDLIGALDPALVRNIEEQEDLWVESRLSQTVYHLSLNPRHLPLNEPLVRQAIDVALDRGELMREASFNYSQPTGQMLSPDIYGYDPGLTVVAQDTAAAKELLRQAGHPDGVELILETTEAFHRVAEIMVRQLAKAGIRATTIESPWPELYARMQAGEVGIWLGAWAFDGPDAGLFFDGMVHSTVEGTAWGSSNSMGGYGDPDLDRLIEAASIESDPAQRLAKFQHISRQMAEQRFYLPLLWPLNIYGLRRDLNWEARQDGLLLLYDMKRSLSR